MSLADINPRLVSNGGVPNILILNEYIFIQLDKLVIVVLVLPQAACDQLMSERGKVKQCRVLNLPDRQELHVLDFQGLQ